jgi:prealbumin domain-containing protein
MSGSRKGTRRATRPWFRLLLAVPLGPAAIVLLVASPALAEPVVPDAAITPALSPSPSPTPSGRFQVKVTDLSHLLIPVAGVTFLLRGPAATGQVRQIKTDGSGIATATGLELGRYCVGQLTAPAGYQLAPTFTPPDGCDQATDQHTGLVSAADPPSATPTPTGVPTPGPTPTPAASAMPTGELQVLQTDSTGAAVTTPGFTFNVSVGTTGGQVIATISTGGNGRAVAAALNPSTYCVVQTATPDGFQLAPTYSPSACVAVAADPTQGRSPSTITVADPPTTTPSPSASAETAALPSAAPPSSRPAAPRSTASALPVAALSRVLIAFGLVLLLVGGVLVALEIRRRRQRRRSALDDAELPPDAWYDSTIT